MAAAVELENRGLPTIAVVTAAFERIAEYVRAQTAHEGLNLLVLPFPLEGKPENELRQIARDAYPRLLEMLGASV